MNPRHILVTFLAICILIFTSNSESSIDKEDFYEPPQSISTHKLTYPKKELRLGREGWVVVSYVVNTDGSVSDAIVID